MSINKNMTNSPLVSVFIVTYNSGDFILDALNSVKSQKYNNIELIVSDDCSKDNTVQIVKQWMEDNSCHFVRTELVESKINTGTSGNYNRAVRACRGEWLKMLDGDDVLLDNCLSDFIAYVEKSPDASIIFSDYDKLICNEKTSKLIHNCSSSLIKKFYVLKPLDQFKTLLKGNILTSSACFIKATLLKENSYNEDYPLLEDIPMWLCLTKKGYQIKYLDKSTVIYRVSNSVTSSTGLLFSPRFIKIRKKFFEEVEKPYMIEYHLTDAYNSKMRYFKWYKWCDVILYNRKNALTSAISKILKLVIYVFTYYKLPQASEA